MRFKPIVDKLFSCGKEIRHGHRILPFSQAIAEELGRMLYLGSVVIVPEKEYDRPIGTMCSLQAQSFWPYAHTITVGHTEIIYPVCGQWTEN